MFQVKVIITKYSQTAVVYSSSFHPPGLGFGTCGLGRPGGLGAKFHDRSTSYFLGVPSCKL